MSRIVFRIHVRRSAGWSAKLSPGVRVLGRKPARLELERYYCAMTCCKASAGMLRGGIPRIVSATQHGSCKRDSRPGAFPNLNEASLGRDDRKFLACLLTALADASRLLDRLFRTNQREPQELFGPARRAWSDTL